MNTPPAHCFVRSFEPEAKKDIRFEQHYLLYAKQGVIQLSNAHGQWLLPPERAAWLPANELISIEIQQPTTSCSLLFDTQFLKLPFKDCRVFNVSPLAQQMMQHCQQWDQDNSSWTQEAGTFFKATAELCFGLAEQSPAFWLPVGKTATVRQAILMSNDRLNTKLDIETVAEKVHTSVRSLSRHLSSETGFTWRTLREQQRMVKAMALLVQQPQSITDVAYEVGYQSSSAFNRTFKKHTGQTPSQYQKLFS
jgi:AraC-like DNA-binding protein